MNSHMALRDRVRTGVLRRRAVETLRAAGIESAELDTRVLLAHALETDAAHLLAAPDEEVDRVGQDRFADAIARRAAHEPVARIIGVKEFWSRDFVLSPDVLVPRPESETLVEAALRAKPNRNAELLVLDLGVGSGALLGAILLERPLALGVGVDRSLGALEVARRNLVALRVGDRVHFVRGNWGEALGVRFDLIVANPPYVAANAIVTLPSEVRDYDPVEALAGGADGLDAYRAILAGLAGLLAPEGIAVLELGDGQERAVAELARQAHISVSGPAIPDLSGRPRALIVKADEQKKTLGAAREPH